ncbi:MAG: dihydroneopterin aldolase [Anaerolineales bacterium]|nr:dihydroneopterin aldolase [Anaerolineales bacterium]
MDKVIIKNLVARGVIGIYDWERAKPQEILINITLFGDLEKAGETDNIENSINYKTVAKQAQSLAENCQRLTVEALASDIAANCLEVKGVKKAIVRVEKPGAVRFAESVGVEIERSN